MHVAHIAIDETEDVAGQMMNRLPDVLPLAAGRAGFRKNIDRETDLRPGGFRHLAGAVGRARVDHGDFIQKRHFVLQSVFQTAHDLADGVLLVQGGNTQRETQTLTLLRRQQDPAIGEFPVMKCGYG